MIPRFTDQNIQHISPCLVGINAPFEGMQLRLKTRTFNKRKWKNTRSFSKKLNY